MHLCGCGIQRFYAIKIANNASKMAFWSISFIKGNFAIYMDRVYRRVMEVFTIQFSRNDRHAIELAY